jgi:glutamate-1-semialdehyde 2,1-aminomutase
MLRQYARREPHWRQQRSEAVVSEPSTSSATAGSRHPISARARELQQRAHALIPGGAHTYAKGDDQYPELAPPFLERGAGCHVWDVDGNEYIEFGMGLRAVTLGHAHPSVTEAAIREMRRGLNFTRPSPLELAAAEALRGLVPSAEMVKFAKNGSDVTTAAVKLARAWTGRDLVAVCANQPFFSTDDWFIGTTAMAAGIPQAIRDLTVRFRYNDLDDLRQLLANHRGRVACLVMEAETAVAPKSGYLAGVQSLCREEGVVFILDEMITGFRWDNGGAQRVHGITPDLTTFGKGMANGFPVSALVGRRDIMEIGGLRHPRERVFLLSTTHGAEHAGLAAALETMRVYRDEPVVEVLYRQGDRLRRGVDQAIVRHGLQGVVEVLGRSCNLVFATRDAERQPSQPMRTVFMQELVRRGVIGPSFVVSYAHTDQDIDRTVEVVAEALAVYRRALDEGPEQHLRGPSVKPVFRARN